MSWNAQESGNRNLFCHLCKVSIGPGVEDEHSQGYPFSTILIIFPCLFPEMKYKEPNFTLKRTFKVENTGQLQINVKTMEISGYTCEGYGFKVVNCQEFALSANASKDIVIL